MFIKLANLVLYVTRVINMNFLSTISVHRQQKTLWELINRSLMGNAFILSYRILSTDPLRKCTDIGVENLYVDTGAWRVKETSGRRGLANPPLVLLEKDLPSTCTLRDLHFMGGSREFCGKLLQSQRQPHVLNLCTPVAVIGAGHTDCYASRGYHSRVPKNNYNF